MEKEKKYIVAPGCSFVGNKKTYKEGDEIDKSAFASEERFKEFINCKPPKIIEAPAEPKETKKDDLAKKMDRKDLEKMAIDKKLLEAEKLAAMKDEDIEKVLKDAGVLK